MIHYLCTRAHPYPIQSYLETWRRDMRWRVSIEFYEDLPYRRIAGGGTYVFSDLERLSDAQRELAQSFWEQLKQAGCRVLNEPRRALRRYDLLKLLSEQGINLFRAYWMNEPHNGLRFPVFIRQENDHTGSLTALLNDEAELSAAMRQVLGQGRDPRHLLIVEYCHTADATGTFRKYSVMRIGDAMIPRHVLFSDNWVNKSPGLTVDPQMVGEETAYQKLNPHEPEVRNIFDIAHIDYGRIDYTMLDRKITVWEINTNPMLMALPEKCCPERLPGQARSAQKMCEALEALDSDGEGVAVRFPRALLKQLGASRTKQLAAAAGRQIKRLKNVPKVRQLVERLRGL
jgi:hypothetical protein